MRIFLSFASEYEDDVKRVAVALRGEHHDVFFSADDLPPGKTYHAQIREAVAASDIFIFFISPESVTQDRYTITELDFAEERWPAPGTNVLPVLIAKTESAEIPPYLAETTFARVKGNFVAGILAQVARLTPIRVRKDEDLDYVEYHSDALGLTFVYPRAILTLDTTHSGDGLFELINLSNETEVILVLSSIPDHNDIREGRRIEQGLLASKGCRMTYIAPEMEKHWSNWFVLSGLGPDGKRFYIRRWYTDRGMVSFEYRFDSSRMPIYNHVIEEMTLHGLVFE